MVTGLGFTPATPMHSARAYAAAVKLTNGTVLVAGGGADQPFLAELYDDQTQSWTGSEMTTTRTSNTVTLLNSGQVLVVGGDTSGNPNTAEVYTPAINSWEKVLNNAKYPRTAHTATLLPDGRVLVTGGLTFFGPALNIVEIFDPGSDPINGSWTVVSPMNDARAYHTATLLPDGMVLVAGGLADSRHSEIALFSAELFDPTTGTWTRTNPMIDTHSGHTATLINFQPSVPEDFVVLIAGGMGTGGFISLNAELYKPPSLVAPPSPTVAGQLVADSSTGSWVGVRSMNVQRMFHTATALPATGGLQDRDHQVLVTGGPDPGNEITTGQTAEIYSLATDSWTLTGEMQFDRTGHVAALLSEGRVLVAGGWGGTPTGPKDAVQSAEIGATCAASAQMILSPTQTLDFGQVPAGSMSNTPNFSPTLQNTGNAELTLTGEISGPDAALFGGDAGKINYVVPGSGPCMAGPTSDISSTLVSMFFNAWSPVPKTCSATLTLSGSNAANADPGQIWMFPMTAQIILLPGDVEIEVTPPFFRQVITVGEAELGEVVIALVPQANESIAGVVRFPPPPPGSVFTWTAGDYIVQPEEAPISISIVFAPRVPGTATQTLELLTNTQAGPFVVHLSATAM